MSGVDLELNMTVNIGAPLTKDTTTEITESRPVARPLIKYLKKKSKKILSLMELAKRDIKPSRPKGGDNKIHQLTRRQIVHGWFRA